MTTELDLFGKDKHSSASSLSFPFSLENQIQSKRIFDGGQRAVAGLSLLQTFLSRTAVARMFLGQEQVGDPPLF